MDKVRWLLVAVVVSLSLVLPGEAQAAQLRATAQPKQVWFRVRINLTTLDWFNEVARPIDIGSLHSRDVAMLGQLSRGVKQVLFTSAAEAERVLPTIADQISDIAYDLEHWPQTPADEQLDPLSAVKRLRTLTDEYGVGLTLAPDRRFTEQYGVQMAPYADAYILQVQRLQATPDALLAFTRPLIERLREANPEIRIVVQLRTEGTVDDMLSLVAAVYDEVDGISVLVNPTTLHVGREFVNRLQAGEQTILAAGTPVPMVAASSPEPGTPAAISTATPRPTRTPVPQLRATRRAQVRATRLAQLTQAPLAETPTPYGDTPWPLADLAATATPRPTGVVGSVVEEDLPVLPIVGGIVFILAAGGAALYWAYRRSLQ